MHRQVDDNIPYISTYKKTAHFLQIRVKKISKSFTYMWLKFSNFVYKVFIKDYPKEVG